MNSSTPSLDAAHAAMKSPVEAMPAVEEIVITSPDRCRPHMRQRGAGDVDRPELCGVNLGAERFGGHLLEEPRLEGGGVGDQEVEVPEQLHGR
jgi:hypothetical protein